MDKRIIFFDCDGTLRDNVLGVLDKTKEAIKELKRRGHYVVLCTGRGKEVIHEDVLELNLDGIIASGGAYIEIFDSVIRNISFEKNKIKKIYENLSKESKNGFIFESNDIVLINKEALKKLEKMNEEKLKNIPVDMQKKVTLLEKIKYEDNIRQYEKYKVNKICLWGSKDIFLKVASELEDFQVIQEQEEYYELAPKGVNKGTAVKLICDFLKVDLSKTISFGDGMNDIDMFKMTKIAVGIKSGDKNIFEYVDSICEDTSENGIYLELKRRKII